MQNYLLSQIIQIEDSDGKPLVGGKLYVYKHGRTDLANTYSDFSGHLNTNPVILDSLGHCTMIAEDTNFYDIQVYDSDDQLQFSMDKVQCVSVGGTTIISADTDVVAGTDIKVTRTSLLDGTVKFTVAVNTNSTIAKGNTDYAFAEGSGNTILEYADTYSFSKTSPSVGAHVEGHNNTTAGVGSHAEGTSNYCEGIAAHAEGASNKVYGHMAHVEGTGNNSYGTYNHIEGANNTIGSATTGSSTSVTHIEGASNTVTEGAQVHVEGAGNTVAGSHTHVEGTGNVVNCSNTHVGGNQNTVNSYSGLSIIGGYNNTVNSAITNVFGKSNNVDDVSNSSIMGESNTVTSDHHDSNGLFIEGKGNSANILSIERTRPDGTTYYSKCSNMHVLGQNNTIYAKGETYGNIVEGIANSYTANDNNYGNVVMGYANELTSTGEVTSETIIGTYNLLSTNSGRANVSIVGTNNRVVDKNSYDMSVFGKSNNVVKPSTETVDYASSCSLVNGYSNIVTGIYKSAVVGAHNTVSGNGSYGTAYVNVFGMNNFAYDIDGGYPTNIVGYMTNNWGNGNNIFGHNNTVYGSKNLAAGHGNTIGASGTDNINNYVIGYTSVAKGRKNFQFGVGLNTNDNNNRVRTVLGQYNLDNENDIFEIGCGTSTSNRKNVVTIDKDNVIKYMYNNSMVQLKPSEIQIASAWSEYKYTVTSTDISNKYIDLTFSQPFDDSVLALFENQMLWHMRFELDVYSTQNVKFDTLLTNNYQGSTNSANLGCWFIPVIDTTAYTAIVLQHTDVHYNSGGLKPNSFTLRLILPSSSSGFGSGTKINGTLYVKAIGTKA